MRSPRLVLLLFLSAQLLDGFFTYVGVRAFGTTAEGNFIIATWMAIIGPVPALIAAKGVAAASGTFIYFTGLHKILMGLTALYAVMAVGPWMAVYLYWP